MVTRKDMAGSRVLIALSLAGVLHACGGKKTQTVDLPRERPMGIVEVVSSPPGAAVILEEGERRLGKTPLVFERRGGTGLKLMLVKDGYQPRRTFVLVEERQRLKHRVVLERERGTLVVRAGAIHGANVLLDGKSVGLTPTRVQVPAGIEVELEVTKNRFQSHRVKLQIAAGETRDVNVDLLPEGFKGPRPGQLTVQGPVGAVIKLRGRLLGMVPLESISLPPGNLALEVRSADGKKQWKRTAVIRSGELTVINLD